MITPKYLSKGDTIGMTSTARKVTREEIEPSIRLLEKLGFNVITAPNIYASENQFAGTDQQRIADFEWLINNPQVDGILCTRGGYGTSRIVDKIDFKPLLSNPKWICGYSDITVLHSHLHNLGLKTIHSTMPINFPINDDSNASVDSLIKALSGEKISYNIPYHPLNKMGTMNGVLIGGNLSILYSLQSSVSDINTNGKILFLEDLDEYLYHIDRMMISIKRGNKLSKIKGLIIGGMSDMHDNLIPFGKSVEEIIHESVQEFSFPVCFGFPAGHIEENYALKMGSNISLSVTKQSTTVTFND